MYNKLYKNKPILLIFLILGVFIITLSGCSYVEVRNPQGISVKSSKVTIAWDPPITNLQHGPYSIARYNIYYRNHGNLIWKSLDSIPYSENPEYTIYHETIGDGIFDISVSAVFTNDEESAYHTSLDTTANPFYGWYIHWTYNE